MIDNIWLIGADQGSTRQVEAACRVLDLHLRGFETIDQALAGYDAAPPALVICDFDAFDTLRLARPQAQVVLLADRADSRRMIEAMKHGAVDCLFRPLGRDELVEHLRGAIRVAGEVETPVHAAAESSPDYEPATLIGQSPAMRELYKLIGLIAPRQINVLITGESGVGKELVARALHEHSPRKDKPMLAVNCAAIPETLLESELFGHEKGAFTGADSQRIGKFEQCDGGTLFLDEAGDIPLSTQAKLLRVLQDHSFQRLGGSTTVQCDVRIVAATHQPLEELIRAERFRQDLYFRLKVATIHVPPLRQREVDSVLLAHYFVERMNRQMGTQVRHFDPKAISALLSYHWPGNVRELENAIRAALVVARGPVLRIEALPEHIAAPGRASEDEPGTPRVAAPTATLPASSASLGGLVDSMASDPTLDGRLHAAAIEALDRQLLRTVLDQCNGQQTAAAKRLGISRTTLRDRMRKLGLRVRAGVEPTD